MKHLKMTLALVMFGSGLILTTGCQNSAKKETDSKGKQSKVVSKLIGKWQSEPQTVGDRKQKVEIRFSDAKITKLVLVEGRGGSFVPKENRGKDRETTTFFFRVKDSSDDTHNLELADNPEFSEEYEKIKTAHLKRVGADSFEWEMGKEKFTFKRQ